jgi:hypothetical protein
LAVFVKRAGLAWSLKFSARCLVPKLVLNGFYSSFAYSYQDFSMPEPLEEE